MDDEGGWSDGSEYVVGGGDVGAGSGAVTVDEAGGGSSDGGRSSVSEAAGPGTFIGACLVRNSLGAAHVDLDPSNSL